MANSLGDFRYTWTNVCDVVSDAKAIRAENMGFSIRDFVSVIRYDFLAMAAPPNPGGIMSAAAKKHHEGRKDDTMNQKPEAGIFRNVEFKSSAGLDLLWKIECDAMKPGDWDCLAARVAERFTFRAVYGAPKGKSTGKDNGAAFGTACRKHITQDGDYFLIVDDVFTTGGSMERARDNTKHITPDLPRIGVTAWNRSGQAPPQWIASIFTYWG